MFRLPKRTLVVATLLTMITGGLIAGTTHGFTEHQRIGLWTTDINGNIKFVFDLHETVYIHWNIPSRTDGQVDIKVYHRNLSPDQTWTGLPHTGVQPYNPSKGTGIYIITCTDVDSPCIILFGVFLVIPELPLGTITGTAASFSALVLVTRKRHFDHTTSAPRST